MRLKQGQSMSLNAKRSFKCSYANANASLVFTVNKKCKNAPLILCVNILAAKMSD